MTKKPSPTAEQFELAAYRERHSILSAQSDATKELRLIAEHVLPRLIEGMRSQVWTPKNLKEGFLHNGLIQEQFEKVGLVSRIVRRAKAMAQEPNPHTDNTKSDLSFVYAGAHRPGEVTDMIMKCAFRQAVVIGDPVSPPDRNYKAEGLVGVYQVIENRGRRNERSLMRPEDRDSHKPKLR